MSNSLLPVNASDFERALEATLSRIESVPIPVDTVWNPDTCPENVLPWLAWSLSIDYWDSTWPVETKRAFIKNSVKVHQHKGTLSSIRAVFENLGVTIELTEWFETSPPGDYHTFSMIAWTDENTVFDSGEPILNPQLYSDFFASINNTKPVRSHFDFSVGVAIDSELGAASLADVVVVVRETFVPTIDTSMASSLAYPAAITVLPYVRIEN